MKTEKLATPFFLPRILSKDGKQVRISPPQVDPKENEKFIAELSAIGFGYQKLIKMGWKKVDAT